MRLALSRLNSSAGCQSDFTLGRSIRPACGAVRAGGGRCVSAPFAIFRSDVSGRILGLKLSQAGDLRLDQDHHNPSVHKRPEAGSIRSISRASPSCTRSAGDVPCCRSMAQIVSIRNLRRPVTPQQPLADFGRLKSGYGFTPPNSHRAAGFGPGVCHANRWWVRAQRALYRMRSVWFRNPCSCRVSYRYVLCGSVLGNHSAPLQHSRGRLPGHQAMPPEKLPSNDSRQHVLDDVAAEVRQLFVPPVVQEPQTVLVESQ